MKIWTAFLLVSLSLAVPRAPIVQRSRVTLPRGIYLYREQLTNDPQFDQALGVAGVDGMALVLDWSALEPSRGAFTTDTIDGQLRMAKGHHVPVELVIRAGRSVPGWVARDAQLTLAYSNHAGLGACLAITMPPPWNPNFQSAFKDVLRRTAVYVRQQGVAISAVKLTGINATSEELRLAAEPPQATTGCDGGAVDDVQVWQKAGFTPTKIQRAFDGLVKSFDEVFPDTAVTLPLIPARPFPPIDEQQQIVRTVKPLNDGILQAMVASAAHTLANRLILQHDFLISGQPAEPSVVALARANRTFVAWQTNLWRGNLREGAACGGAPQKGTPCTDEQFLDLLRAGIHPDGGAGPGATALYIEVFPFDALAHQGAIATAHAELTGRR